MMFLKLPKSQASPTKKMKLPPVPVSITHSQKKEGKDQLCIKTPGTSTRTNGKGRQLIRMKATARAHVTR